MTEQDASSIPSSGSDYHAPPAVDQIEVTILGPGYGESILVHLGNNHWIMVDSCIDNRTGAPAGLTYLRDLGLDPAEVVKLIIATHWHDDHIRGLGQVVAECTSARFCSSSALKAGEFVATVCRFDERNRMSEGAGVREIITVLETLASRTCRPPLKAIANRSVYSLYPADSGHGRPCKVWTLSPSDRQVEKFLYEITSLMPQLKQTKYRAVSQRPNHLSVVTWVEIGDLAILLGGDLEETKDAWTGWSIIVASQERPKGKASIFKIPHHGSETGHNPELWTQMLTENPFAVLTPYIRGGNKLPSRQDVQRIERKTPHGYSTAPLQPVKSKRQRPAAVEKQIRETVGKLRFVEPRTGIIRLRNGGHAQAGGWQVEMFQGACPLNQVYAGNAR